MSLVELILSRKEVVISLIFVALIMLAAFAVVVGPALKRRQKKRAALRKARQAAKALQKQEQVAKRKAKKQRRRKDEDGDAEEAPAVGEPAVAAVAEAKPTKAQAALPAVPTVDATVPEQTETPEEETATDMQDLLASVFMDDEENSRHEVLMRGVVVPSADELLALSQKIAGDLRAKSG